MGRRRRIRSKRPRQDHEFDSINPPLTALDPGDERLLAAQALGECRLGQACRLSGLNERRDQRRLSFAP